MCGRFTLTTRPEGIFRDLGVDASGVDFVPSYNIAPTQQVLAIVEVDGIRSAVPLRWGLVPRWARDPAIGSRLINARGETLAAKPSFRDAFRKRRCLVLADGFYEWVGEAGGKQPVRVRSGSGAPFAFGGLWEEWRGAAADQEVRSCAVVTTAANEALRSIHKRMPLILGREDRAGWLEEGATRESLEGLVRPYEAEDLVVDRVSKLVNSPANDEPACIEPLPAPEGHQPCNVSGPQVS